MNQTKKSYSSIKADILDAYFDFCRDRGIALNMPHEQILGSVDNELEGTYSTDIETLMFFVVMLVLSGGWYKDASLHIQKKISELLKRRPIEELINDMPNDESRDLLHDMKALKLI